MERRRIVIETGEDVAGSEQYQVLTDKLDDIKKKLTAPWVMPVILAVLGATLTLSNAYLLQEQTSAKLYRNKVREKVAELRAKTTVEFYGDCVVALDSLDASLQSYCEFTSAAEEEKIIQNKLSQLYTLVRQHEYIDPAACSKIRSYADFVAVKVFKTTPAPTSDALASLYQKSANLYKEANGSLIRGIENISK